MNILPPRAVYLLVTANHPPMKSANSFPSALESLESRLAPAGLVTLSLSASGALSITGDVDHNDFQITESGSQWTISKIYDDPGNNTQFRLNGGAQQDTITFDKPLSVVATLGAGDDEMLLNGTEILKTLNVNTGDGNDTLDLTSTTIDGTVTVTMGNGDDYFTAGGNLYFGKGLSVNLGKGPNTFDVNADELISLGNISATAGGGLFEQQTFRFQTGIGEVYGGLTLKTTTGSPTNFEIGSLVGDSLFVSKGMTLQSSSGLDNVTLVGDLTVSGLLALRLGNGTNTVFTEDLDQLVTGGLTYTGGTGTDDFLLEARVTTVNGNFTFSAGAGTNFLEIIPGDYIDITGGLTYTGGTGDDSLLLAGPDVFITKTLSMSASSGTNSMKIDSVLADVGAIRYTGGSGYDRLDIGETGGGSDLVTVLGAVSLSLGTGAANVQVIHSDIRGNLSIATSAALGLADDVRLFESEFRGHVSIGMSGGADSYVEVRNGIFDQDVYVSTGNGWDEVRFDTDTTVPGIYSWFDGYVTISLGAGDDVFYAGSNPTVENVGNDFNSYVDVYGGSGYDSAYFISSLDYNNGFNGPLPWWTGIEDPA